MEDATWLVPLAGLTAGLLATDRNASRYLSNSPHRLDLSRNVSNYGVASLAGAAGGLYLWGKATQDEHKRETGLLSAEALLNSLVVSTAIQFAAGRRRPREDHSRGRFWQGGRSFPSDHAAAAWSVAGVIAHEYPGPLTKLLAYGAASVVSASRITGKNHFPSDVLVGSAIGWFAGQRVYRAHHNRELDGDPWETSSEKSEAESSRHPENIGSPYVPLDGWLYPALERLAALGYVTTALSGMKPWTRAECARLIEEADEAIQDAVQENRKPTEEVVRLHEALERELAFEIEALGSGRKRSFRLESVYARVTSISGAPLTDGFHFGQTISYDFGRPFRRGTNTVAGTSWRASTGPMAFYLRAEFQHAPSAPALSDTVRGLIATVDVKPLLPTQGFDPVNRVRLLDTYVGVNLRNWQLSFGKQSLSWGPGPGGALLFSDNAEPVTMLRLTRVAPFEMPSFLRYLGPVRLDQFIGRVGGGTFVIHPFLYGQKITLKPRPYFEIGFARTVLLGGRGGDPFNTRNLFKTLFGLQGNPKGPGLPGDSRSAVDWVFRIPGLRDYVILYADLFADDDELPYSNPPRATLRPGLHLTRIPGVPKLDFTIEAASSESPGFPSNHGNLNYWNGVYRDGYTNNGFLLGNTVGRQGRAIQVWSTLWFSPGNLLQLSFKHNSVSPHFIPGGGYWEDYSARHELHLRSGLYVKSFMQYEHIRKYPVLFNGPVNNFSASVELGFAPGQGKP